MHDQTHRKKSRRLAVWRIPLAVLFILLPIVEATGQDLDLSVPLSGPVEPSLAGYRYEARVGKPSNSIDEVILYDFCNLSGDSSLSFAWVEPGFGLLTNSALAKGECAYFERGLTIKEGLSYVQKMKNSNIIFSGGNKKVANTYVECLKCIKDDLAKCMKCLKDELGRTVRGRTIGDSYAELRAIIKDTSQPTGRHPLSINVFSNFDSEKGVKVSLAWKNLPPMSVALTIARPAEDAMVFQEELKYKIDALANLMIVPQGLQRRIDPKNMAIVLFGTYDLPNGEMSVFIPQSIAVDYDFLLTGFDSDGKISFFADVVRPL